MNIQTKRKPSPMNLRLFQVATLPMLYCGHTDDLLMEYKTIKGKLRRVWRSRMTTQDGQPYNNQITVEEYIYDNKKGWHWIIIKMYEAKP